MFGRRATRTSATRRMPETRGRRDARRLTNSPVTSISTATTQKPNQGKSATQNTPNIPFYLYLYLYLLSLCSTCKTTLVSLVNLPLPPTPISSLTSIPPPQSLHLHQSTNPVNMSKRSGMSNGAEKEVKEAASEPSQYQLLQCTSSISVADTRSSPRQASSPA